MNITAYKFVRKIHNNSVLATNVSLRTMLRFMETHQEDAAERLTQDYETLYGNELTNGNKTKLILRRNKRKRIETAHLVTDTGIVIFSYDERINKQINPNPIMIKPISCNNRIELTEYDTRTRDWTNKYDIYNIFPYGPDTGFVSLILNYIHPKMLLKMRLVCKIWKSLIERDVNWSVYHTAIINTFTYHGLRPMKWTELPLWKQVVLYLCVTPPSNFPRLLATPEYGPILLLSMKLYSKKDTGQAYYKVDGPLVVGYTISSRIPLNRASMYIQSIGGAEDSFLWVPPKACRLFIPTKKNKEGRKEITVQAFMKNYCQYIKKVVDVEYMMKVLEQ